MIRARLALHPIDIAEAWAQHLAACDDSPDSGDCGGNASFLGRVRGDGGLCRLFLEHHPTMTAAVLQSLAEQAQVRWSLSAVTLLHRGGEMQVGEPIVLIITSSAHRAAALDSCRFLIDRIKVDVPFWKKEIFSDGHSQWVEQRETDIQRARVWE